jgi:hypothetical protein
MVVVFVCMVGRVLVLVCMEMRWMNEDISWMGRRLRLILFDLGGFRRYATQGVEPCVNDVFCGSFVALLDAAVG